MQFHSPRKYVLFGLMALALPAVLLAKPARADFSSNVYSAGHADLGVRYEGGSSFIVGYEFGSNAVINGIPNGNPPRITELLAGDATVFTPDAARILAPAGGLPFLSVAAGSPAWILPQGNTVGLPFLGFAATEDLDPDEWASPITFRLTGFSSSTGGDFAVWQSGALGSTVFMQTNDGLSAADSIARGAGLHDHYNLGFSRAGVYDITLTATGTRVGGQAVSGSGTFRFQVGPFASSAVPEPASLAMVGIGLAGGGLAWARRRLKREVAATS